MHCTFGNARANIQGHLNAKETCGNVDRHLTDVNVKFCQKQDWPEQLWAVNDAELWAHYLNTIPRHPPLHVEDVSKPAMRFCPEWKVRLE
jgi:hypothetical protein